MHRPALPILLLALSLSSVVTAQSPTLRAGLTGGAVKLSDSRDQQVVTGILEYDPAPWLSLSLIPSRVRVSETLSGRSVARSGFADLPVAASVSHTLPTAWSPDVGAGFTVTLPTGKASCGLSSGVTSVGANAGLSVAPSKPVRLSVDASRSLTGGVALSALNAAGGTWLSSAASVVLSSRWSGVISFGAELGQLDSLRRAGRELGAGVSYAPRGGPLALTLDGSHGLAAGSPKWALSLGIGTAFVATSPVTPTAPLRRLRTTFAGGSTQPSSATITTCR